MQRSRVARVALMGLAIMLITACSFTSVLAAKPVTIGYVSANLTATSQVRTTNAFKAQTKEIGWKVIAADAKGSWPALADQIENFVQMNVDVIVIAMSDLPSIKAAITTANKANIPVISIDSGVADGVIADITTDNYAMGTKVSKYMAERLNGKGNIIVFKFDEHHGTRTRGDALDDVLVDYPQITVLATHYLPPAGFMQDAQARTETDITKFGDKIDAVWCPWDGPAMAATMALQASRIGRDKCFVTGVDGEQETFNLIRSGSPLVATVAQPFELMSKAAIKLVGEIVVNGRPVDQVVPPTKTIYVDAPLVTPDNVPAKGAWPWD
ncbi:MAG: sugar ABC transporter substrate-binding protein [Firmicutes bacterium]|nr:sugar ABC transporter substrate-binding protein [Bacillota bacterium]